MSLLLPALLRTTAGANDMNDLDGATADQRRPAEPVLDRMQIDGLVAAAGVAGTREIIDAFQRSTDGLMAALRDQLGKGDFGEASKTAHALKGSASNVGAVRLATAARDIEDACRRQDGVTALMTLTGLQTQYADAVSAFDEHLAAAA